jgi:hypothetical protein
MKGHMKMHGEHHAHGEHVHHMVKKHSMHSMKHRSHHAKGGKVEHGHFDEDPTPSDVYAGGNSPTVHEAEEKHAARKHGGRAKKHPMHGKHLEMHGHKAHHRLDRPARKSGGAVGGSEMRPLSAANKVKTPAGRMVDPGES